MIRRVWQILLRERGKREDGVALLTVTIMVVVIATMISDFAFNATVDYRAATNARDELRAHYLSRSSINLAKLLLKVQTKLIDPNRKYFGGMDIQIADYAPTIVSAFNSSEGVEGLGALFGISAAGVKGVGVDIGSFDLQMDSLDGRLNINCGGGANTGAPQVLRFAAAFAAMVAPQRYNRLFEEQDADGQYADRIQVLRAVIDWSDQDTVIFGGSAGEDYHYDARKEDAYRTKNQYFDTLEEIRLIRGIGDDFMAAFGESLTAYGTCQINVGLATPELLAGLIVQYAATPTDPALRWENLALLVRYVVQIREMMGGFTDIKTFSQAVENPLAQLGSASALDAVTGGSSLEKTTGLPPVLGVKLNNKLSEAVVVGGSRRIWRITASAEVGKVKKKISAVWDMKLVSRQAGQYSGPGGYLYWREE
jgi:type II secretory pathway component PulK